MRNVLPLLLVILGLGAARGLAEPVSQDSGGAESEARVAQFKAAANSFRLELTYAGEEGKPFYRLSLSVPPIGEDRSNPFYRLAQIKPKEAERLIDYLAAEGFFARAVDRNRVRQFAAPAMPGYTLTVANGGGQLSENLGWGLPMLRRLDGLRKVLEGAAAEQMDLLLGRLSGLRAAWESAAGQ